MKRSIFSKIFGGYLLITLLLSALILAFSFNTIKSHYIDTLTRDLKNLAVGLQLKITPLLEEQRFEELDGLVKRLGRDINTRVTVIGPDGTVYADSEKNPELMENHGNRPEVMEALREDMGTSLRYSFTVEEEMLYVAIPVKRDGKPVGILRVSLFLRDISGLLADLRTRILRIVLLVMVASLVGAVILSKGLSNPIRELARGAQRVASGDFGVSIVPRDRGELKELADSFNHMTEKLRTLFADLSLQKEELHSIISSIKEGLLVLDEKGRITLSNDSFNNVFQTNSTEERHYWEVLRAPALSDLIKRVTLKKQSLTEEIEVGDKVFLSSATYITSSQEIVLIFHDITEIKALEKTKRDFVLNVSHELRTPLAAIKGFVETMEEEIEPSHKHYLDIIKKHTDRLTSIVQDLLSLSELEDAGFRPELSEVDLESLIGDALRIFDQKIREKGLVLRLNVDKKASLIKGDPFRLEQLFMNLIDNAIKYTEKGEIRISLAPRDEEVRIEIEDTGIGIPKEHLGRIFERFYVADKSRSRKLGGTGLGLSIAKHIALLHNGEIDVESTPGVGTRFVITLPLNPA